MLLEGLPALPAKSTPLTTMPLAFWKTEDFGFVMFTYGGRDVCKERF